MKAVMFDVINGMKNTVVEHLPANVQVLRIQWLEDRRVWRITVRNAAFPEVVPEHDPILVSPIVSQLGAGKLDWNWNIPVEAYK